MPMLTSRKHFLQQAGFAFVGSLLPFSKTLATATAKKFVLDTYHPKDCGNDLTGYQYTYSNNPNNSQITVSDEFYSKIVSGGSASVNPLVNDPEYALEGDGPNDSSPCNPSANDCRSTDIDGLNPFRYRSLLS